MPLMTHLMLSYVYYATLLRMSLMHYTTVSWMESTMSMKENVPQTFRQWHAWHWSDGPSTKTWTGKWWSLSVSYVLGMDLG
jgi:hypothetical protein